MRRGVRAAAAAVAAGVGAALAGAGAARADGGLAAFEGCGERMQENQGMILGALGPCVVAEGASDACCAAMADTFGHANAVTGGCLCYEGVVEGVLSQASLFMPGAADLVTDVVATCASEYGAPIPFVFPGGHGHKDPKGHTKGLCAGVEDPSATLQGTVPTHEPHPGHPSQHATRDLPAAAAGAAAAGGGAAAADELPEYIHRVVDGEEETIAVDYYDPAAREPAPAEPAVAQPAPTEPAPSHVHVPSPAPAPKADTAPANRASTVAPAVHHAPSSTHPSGKLSVEECGLNLDANRASLIGALGPCIASNGASDMCCSALENTFGAGNAETGGCLCYGSLVSAILEEARAFVPQAETMIPAALSACEADYGTVVPWSLDSGPGVGLCHGYEDIPSEDQGPVRGSQAVDVIAEQSLNIFSILTVEACSTNLQSERAAMAQALQPCILSMGASEKCCDALEEAFGGDNEVFGHCMCHPEVLDGVVEEAAAFLPTARQVVPAIMQDCVTGFKAEFSFAGQQGGVARCPGEETDAVESIEGPAAPTVEVRQVPGVDVDLDLGSASANIDTPAGNVDVRLDSGSFAQKAAMAVLGGGVLLLSALL